MMQIWRQRSHEPMGRMSERRFDRARSAIEPAMRRLLHLVWRFTRGLTLGARALVVDEAGRILLVQHSYAAGWSLPGGGVEPGETVREALARELAEEGNIKLLGAPQFV